MNLQVLFFHKLVNYKKSWLSWSKIYQHTHIGFLLHFSQLYFTDNNKTNKQSASGTNF